METHRGSGRRGQARTDAILDAALELVGEIGYGQVTTDAIAARAQASKTTLYRKWPTKAALLADALRRQSEDPRPGAPDTGGLRSDLVATVNGIVASLSGGHPLSLLSLTEAIRGDPALRDLVRRQIYDRCTADGAVICGRAVKRGELDSAHLGPAALRLTVSQMFASILLTGEPPSGRERDEFVDTVLLPMLGARPPSSP
jgi:AcrR family transcriptional regulator